MPALLFGGCAGVAEVTGTATQDDVFQLRSEIAAAQQSAQRAKVDVDRLSAQVDRHAGEQARESQRRAAALTERLDALAATLATLTARVEDVAARLDALTRQVRAAAARPVSPPPARPGPPAQAPPAAATATARPAPAPAPPSPIVSAPGASAPVPAPVPQGTASAPAKPSPVVATPSPPLRPTTGTLKPQDIYQAAYIDFSKGSYSLAIAGFREFLRRFPEHDLAGNAQYWIGESYLSLARGYANAGQEDKAAEALTQAVLEFKKVLANSPRSDKVPTALYKEALALIDLKQPQQAQARLQYLIENFPQAEETPLAKERLASLKSG